MIRDGHEGPISRECRGGQRSRRRDQEPGGLRASGRSGVYGGNAVRFDRDWCRAGWICGGDPCRAARHEGGVCREEPHAGWDVPERRVHPEQGDARLERAVPPGEGAVQEAWHPGRGLVARPGRDAGSQERGGQGADGRGPLPLSQEQDRAGLRHGAGQLAELGPCRAERRGERRSPDAPDLAGDRLGAVGIAVPAVRRAGRRRFDRCLELRPCPRPPGGDRRRLHRSGAGVRLESAGGEGDRARIPAADCPAERPGTRHHAPQEPRQAGAGVPPGDQGDRRDRRGGPRDGPCPEEGRDRGDLRMQPGAGRRRASAVHAGPGARRGRRLGRSQDGESPGRRPLPHQRADDLGDRRPDRGPDARPQGGGRGNRLRRDPGGEAGPRQLRHDPERDLHLARAGQRRA